MASTTATISAGAQVANVESAANGASQPRTLASWLPGPQVPLCKADPKTGLLLIETAWYRFLHELTLRLGGIKGVSIADVSASVSVAQSATDAAATNVAGVIATLNSTLDATNTLRQVAINNGQTGAAAVPAVDRYEARYG